MAYLDHLKDLCVQHVIQEAITQILNFLIKEGCLDVTAYQHVLT